MNQTRSTYTIAPCGKCHGPEICHFPPRVSICGDCATDEQIEAGNGGHPDWACN